VIKKKRPALRVLLVAAALICSQAVTSNAADWWQNMKLKGDLRYRHETIDQGKKPTRTRHRVRTRLGISGKASDHFKVGLQLATGSNDPVSTNQTLGDAFTTKTIGVDLAYFTFEHEKLPGLEVSGGKFKNPFITPGSSELIWDSDWNPEGGAAHLTTSTGQVELDLIGAGLWVVERSTEDSYIAAGQGVINVKIGEASPSNVSVGAAFFDYVNAQGFATFYEPDNGKGNSTDYFARTNDTIVGYATGFEILELSAEYSHKFNNTPLTLMADFATNTAADSLNTGWLVGATLGKAKEQGSWDVRYIYRRVEKDAVVGAFTDSDFRGGGTDAKGHEIGGTYMVDKNAGVSVSYFNNEIGLEQTKTTNFQRLQVDLQLHF